MVIIFMCALLIRLIGIEAQSLWFDEACTALFVSQGTFGETLSLVRNDIHPPLYFLVMHGWVRVFGGSDLSLRAPSAIFDAAACCGVYAIACSLMTRRAAQFAAVLAALSPFQIWYAREARPYSLAVFLSVLATFAFLRLAGATSRKAVAANVALYGVISAALLHTNYLAGTTLAVHLLCALFLSQRLATLLRLGVAFGLCALIGLPWVLTAMGQVAQVKGAFWLGAPTGSDFARLLASFFAGPHGAGHWNVSLGVLVTLTLFGILWLVTFRASEITTDRTLRFLPWIWCVVPPVSVWMLSHSPLHLFTPKALISSSAGFSLVVAQGVFALRHSRTRALFGALLLLPGIALYPWYIGQTLKDDWRAAAQFFDAESQVGDQMSVQAPGAELPLDRYRHGPHIQVLRANEEPVTDRVWFVRSLSTANMREINSHFAAQGYVATRRKRFYGIYIVLFEKKTEVSPPVGR